MELVSVIVPVYNVEAYLNRCVESIVNQTYRNLEIILIDDGSPDKCPQMCDEWARRDGRIRVVHKQNEGLGMARNTGLETATGDFICFFDSDDYVEADTIERSIEAAQKYDADIVCYGMIQEDSRGRIISKQIPRPPKTVYRNSEILDTFIRGAAGMDPETGENWNFSLSACTKLFSARCVKRNGWEFVSEREIISEDFYSLMRLFRDVNTVCIIPRAFYHYCANEKSLTHTYQQDRFERVCNYYREILKLCDECGYPKDVGQRLSGTYMGGVIATLKQIVASNLSFKEKISIINTILDNELLQGVLNSKVDSFENWRIKLLFWTMRNKMGGICWLLVALQNQANKT